MLPDGGPVPGRTVRVVVAAALFGASGAATGPAGASAAPPTTRNVLRGDVRIEKFVVNHSGLTALGTQSATLNGRSAEQKATFAVSKGSSCNVLTLNLQQLNLQLLGLNLVTSAINLKITGRSSESLG